MLKQNYLAAARKGRVFIDCMGDHVMTHDTSHEVCRRGPFGPPLSAGRCNGGWDYSGQLLRRDRAVLGRLDLVARGLEFGTQRIGGGVVPGLARLVDGRGLYRREISRRR